MRIAFIGVHGGIRHLERMVLATLLNWAVHGGIRHLENFVQAIIMLELVHGGIRHLEILEISDHHL